MTAHSGYTFSAVQKLASGLSRDDCKVFSLIFVSSTRYYDITATCRLLLLWRSHDVTFPSLIPYQLQIHIFINCRDVIPAVIVRDVTVIYVILVNIGAVAGCKQALSVD